MNPSRKKNREEEPSAELQAVPSLHSWDLSIAEARRVQEQLSSSLRFPLQSADFRWVAGADVAYDQTSRQMIAAVVLFDIPSSTIIEKQHVFRQACFPYVPGFLSFREAPAVLDAWKLLSKKPQALILDGQGLAHPRRFGLACHLGLWLDIPAVGCAKSRLIGEYLPPDPEAGSWTQLLDKGEEIGAVLRTRKNVRPLFVSPGHLLPLPLCIQTVLNCCRGYRLPEPTRQAHLEVTRLRKALMIRQKVS